MKKYTDEQLAHASRVTGGGLKEYQQRCFIDYLRSDESKDDIEAGVWDEPLDPIEKARRDAREIVAKCWEKRGFCHEARISLAGERDRAIVVEGILIALCQERGLEVPK